jgi:competence protein ComEA
MTPPAPSGGAFTVQHGSPMPATAPPATTVAPAAANLTTPWPHRVQWAVALLLCVAVVLLVAHAVVVQATGSRPATLQRGAGLGYRVDLNKAKRAELLQLPGIGPTLVERIERFREDNGGFASVEELTKVRGIGPATLQRLRPFVCVNGGEFDDEGADPETGGGKLIQRTSAYPPSGGKKRTTPTGPINVNRATQDELRQLPGIGPVLSQRILEARRARPFAKVDDLRRVTGIGPKTLEKLRPHVTVGDD